MLKVFLAEDEYIVREGIKNNIDWEAHGLEFCGEAADGEVAYPMILELRPDILITDIKMPFIDGLALIRLVKKELPHISIIILSGHSEFEYAQEAIKMGVDEYLLKPVNAEGLLDAVLQVSDQIYEKRNEKEYISRYEAEMLEQTEYSQQLFLKNILSGKLSPVEIIEQSQELKLELHAKYYKVLILKIDLKKSHNHDQQKTLEEAIKSLHERFEQVHLIEQSFRGHIYLLQGFSEEDIDIQESRFIGSIRATLEGTDIVLSGGSGLCVDRLGNLNKSYLEAEKAYAIRHTTGINQIYSQNHTSTDKMDEEIIPFERLEISSMDQKKVDSFIRSAHESEVEPFVDEFINKFGGVTKQSQLLLQYVIMNVYVSALTLAESVNKKTELTDRFTMDEEALRKLVAYPNHIRTYFIDIITSVIQLRDSSRDFKNKTVINNAMQFICEHYSDQNLSLQTVADYVNLSPNHFSSVFSQVTGKSFIRFLTDERVKEAKKLLKCTDARCGDIALQVGYQDPHYFSHLFKKEEGISPMQYRRGSDD